MILMFKKLLSNINPVEALKLLKKSDEKVMTKGVLQMGGSGLLIPSGVGLITDGAAGENWYEITSGAIMLLVGAVLAIMLSDNIEKLKNGKHTTDKEL